ncbi:MAG: hypothetical protein ABGX16_18725 [Pirellulales bacterium]
MKLLHWPTLLTVSNLLLMGGLIGVGCRPQEKIATYRVDETSSRAAVDVDRLAGQLDHLLAAVVPQGNKAWFFKLVGPQAAIDRHRDEFLQLLGSLRMNTGKNPSWQIPSGWQEKPASGMRAATFTIDDLSGPLELTVTSLPVNGVWNEYVTNNVNRWLNQLQQAPLETVEVLALLKTVPIGEDPQEGAATVTVASWLELVGVMPRKPKTGSMPAGHPPIASGSNKTEASTATEGSPPQPQTASPLTFAQPAAWQPGRVGGMRKAAFQIVEGDKRAEMTVIDLSSGASGITDVAANVRRWAGQIGLQDTSGEQLEQLTHPVKIDGIDGHHAVLLSPNADGKGLLAAMVERDGKVWFFKLTGDRSLVDKQQQAFADFLKSVKFSNASR